jgi:ABC-type uncharacterized transport system substrate-binding protein
MVARVVQGTDPADIPVQFAQNLELVLNTEVAVDIGLPLDQAVEFLTAFSDYLKAQGTSLVIKTL